MSAARFMRVISEKEQQYLETYQSNSFFQFKQTVQSLGFQQTQPSLMSFKNDHTPSTAENSPYFFSKQDEWQKNQEQKAQQISSSSTKSYFAKYPIKQKTTIEERYQQHNSQSLFMNRMLSISPSMDQLESQSPIVTAKTTTFDQKNDTIIKKSNLKDKVKQSFKINGMKKSVKIAELITDRDCNEKRVSPKKQPKKTQIKTVEDFLNKKNSPKKNK